jgi:putative membrane protein
MSPERLARSRDRRHAMHRGPFGAHFIDKEIVMSDIRFTTKAVAVALAALGFALSAAAQTGTIGSTGNPGAASSAGMSPSTGAPSSRGTTDNAARTSTKSPSASLDRSDRKFIESAAVDGMAEVQLGQLAASKAGSDDVRKFGQRMVDDHSKANDQLKQIASGKGVTLPTDLDAKHKREHDRLSKLSGADFDREYMKLMMSEHKKDVKEFQSTAKSAKDADVKNFASSTLPKLQEHLSMAQSTDDAVRSASRSGGVTKSGSSASGRSSSSGSTGTSSSVTGGTGKASGAGTATAQGGTGTVK